MARVPVGADADLNASGWVSGAAKVKSSAVEAQGAIDNLIKSLKEAQAVAGLSGTTSVKATVDTSDIESAVSLRSLLEDPTSFVASAEESDIDAAVDVQNRLNENTSFVAAVSDSELNAAKGLHDDLSAPIDTRVNVNDSEMDTAKRKRGDIEAPIDTKVNVDDQEVQSLLKDIKGLQTIQVGLSIAGGATDAVGGIAGVFTAPIQGIIEMDDALKKLEGTTGRTIPQARELIIDLYTNAWGDSKTQIAEVVTLAAQLGITEDKMADAILSAFEAASVTGHETNEILRAQDVLVKQGLVPTHREAADLIVAGFQRGGDRADDMLDTIIEYSSSFKDLGLTGPEAMGMVIAAMDKGAMNTDLAADALREFRIRAKEVGNETIDSVYEQLGLEETVKGFRDGTVSGKVLLEQVLLRMNDLDPTERARVGVELFGTQSEDLTLQLLEAFDPAVNGLTEVEGKAKDASTAVNSTLGTAFTTLKRNVENEFQNFLQDTFDIDALIEDLTTAINTFFANLSAGDNIFGAAEDAFGLGGLEETMQTIQRIFAEMAIGILEAVASISEFFNQDSLAEDIRGVVADISEIQLGADLFAADDQQELADSLARALDRGVAEADVGMAIMDQFYAIRDSGDLVGALDFLNTVGATEGLELFNLELLREKIIGDINQVVNEALASGDLITAIENAPSEEVRESIRARMADDLARGVREGFEDAESLLQAMDYASYLDPTATGLQSALGLIGLEATAVLAEGFEEALASGDFDLATRIAEKMDDAAMQAQVEEMRASIETIADSSDETAQEFGTDTEAIAADMDSARSGIDSSVAGSVLRMVALGLASALMQSTIGTKLSAMATDWVDTSGVVGDETDKMSNDFEDGAGKMGETHIKVRDDMATTSDEFVTDAGEIVSQFGLMADGFALWREISVTEFTIVGDEFSRMVDRFQVNAERLGGIIDNIVADFGEAGTLTLPVSVSGGGGGSNVTNNSSVTNNNNVSVNTSNGATVAASIQQVSNAVRTS